MVKLKDLKQGQIASFQDFSEYGEEEIFVIRLNYDNVAFLYDLPELVKIDNEDWKDFEVELKSKVTITIESQEKHLLKVEENKNV